MNTFYQDDTREARNQDEYKREAFDNSGSLDEGSLHTFRNDIQ